MPILGGEARARSFGERKWLAGDNYSLADICTYSICFGVPFLYPEAMNDKASPRSMAWLNAVSERPATKAVMATRPPRQ